MNLPEGAPFSGQTTSMGDPWLAFFVSLYEVVSTFHKLHLLLGSENILNSQ